MSELQEARWYVVHTYSGHENKVKATMVDDEELLELVEMEAWNNSYKKWLCQLKM